MKLSKWQEILIRLCIVRDYILWFLMGITILAGIGFMVLGLIKILKFVYSL